MSALTSTSTTQNVDISELFSKEQLAEIEAVGFKIDSLTREGHVKPIYTVKLTSPDRQVAIVKMYDSPEQKARFSAVLKMDLKALNFGLTNDTKGVVGETIIRDLTRGPAAPTPPTAPATSSPAPAAPVDRSALQQEAAPKPAAGSSLTLAASAERAVKGGYITAQEAQLVLSKSAVSPSDKNFISENQAFLSLACLIEFRESAVNAFKSGGYAALEQSGMVEKVWDSGAYGYVYSNF